MYIHIRHRKREKEEQEAEIQSDTDLALGVFDEPVYTTKFSVDDVRNWAQKHKSVLRNGGKALAAKVTNKTFGLMNAGLKSKVLTLILTLINNSIRFFLLLSTIQVNLLKG